MRNDGEAHSPHWLQWEWRICLPSWDDTYGRLAAAERDATLDATELEQLAVAAYLTGRDVDSIDALTRAHHACLDAGDARRAARCAFWLAFTLIHLGERVRAAGWLARAQRLVDECGQDCAERGYLLLPAALQHAAAGDLAAAQAAFAEAARIGERFGEPDLVNLGRQGHGRALINLGEIAQGVALLDEVMVAATSGELSPAVAGTVYCSVISACFEMLDIRRAQEWTDALDHWCASQAGLVPYHGQCLVHRAEILAIHGVWLDALGEAQRARERLTHPAARPVAGAALYQIAELHRLRGDLAPAEEAYGLASESGRSPQPGLALLRLAQGRADLAKAAIVRVLDEARDRRTRSLVLAAAIEILLAADDRAAARAAADELATIAGEIGTPFLRALAAQSAAAVRLAEGDAKASLASARAAWTIWCDLEAPYEAARATVLIGLACRALGDADGAQLELAAASRVFAQLGAVPDVERTDALLTSSAAPAESSPLTSREVEVLRLVASGKTNRAIADDLEISEKTVARHLSNIFTKLDLSSRAAATAYAFKHQLV